MNLTGTRNIASQRFNEVNSYLIFLTEHEPTSGTPASSAFKISKGLFFVLLYSAFEKIINSLVESTLAEVKSKSYPNKDIANEFKFVTMSRRWLHSNQYNERKLFEKIVGIFSNLDSGNSEDFDETIFSKCLQNVWYKSLVEVNDGIGVNMTIDISTQARIDELVGLRNAISHGRESAEDIGQRFTVNELLSKRNEIQNFTFSYISVMELFLDGRNYLNSSARLLLNATP